jgi:hypothetical protein
MGAARMRAQEGTVAPVTEGCLVTGATLLPLSRARLGDHRAGGEPPGDRDPRSGPRDVHRYSGYCFEYWLMNCAKVSFTPSV